MSRLAAALGLAALAVLVPAGADEGHAVRALAFTYLPPLVTVHQGDALAFTNLDLDVHTLTAEDLGPDGKPLFDTSLGGVTFLQTEQVRGVPSLPRGSYRFYCQFHPQFPGMHGVLDVV